MSELEQRLARAEALVALHRVGFEQAAYGLALVALDGRFAAVNSRLCEITGYPADELRRRRYQDITHPDDHERDAAALQALLVDRRPHHRFEKRYLRPDGSVVWVGLAISVLHDERGEPLCFHTAVEDVGERKRLQDQLAERDLMLRQLAEYSPSMIWATLHPHGGGPQDTTMPFASAAIRTLYELEPGDVQGGIARLIERTPPEERERIHAVRENAYRNGLPLSFESPVDLPRAGRRWLSVHGSAPLATPRGVMAWGITTDITERKLYEQARIAAEAAEAANRAKTDFLSRMSHELRTPLNAVIGFAQLLRIDSRDPLTPGQAARVALIERAGAHLLAVLGDVLDLSRIEAGALPMSLEVLRLADSAQEALELARESAAQAGVRMLAPQVSAGLHVHADRVRLRQVLVNLLSNAVKYNVAGGSVELRGRREGDTVVLEVADTGIGLDESQRARLFQPFERLGAEHTGIEGTGIGLVIVQRLLALMNGSIEVDSTPGGGSVFALRLPAAEPLPPPVSAELPGPPAPATQAGHGFCVLYAEDNEVNVALVRQIFALRPAWRLEVARSGAETLALAARVRPDLLLLDMHLGDMSGFEVADALARAPAGAALPRIALSADAMPDQVRRARERGFVAYLTKPVDVAQLLATLDEQAARRAGGAQA